MRLCKHGKKILHCLTWSIVTYSVSWIAFQRSSSPRSKRSVGGGERSKSSSEKIGAWAKNRPSLGSSPMKICVIGEYSWIKGLNFSLRTSNPVTVICVSPPKWRPVICVSPTPLPSTLNSNIFLESALVVQSLTGPTTNPNRLKTQISIFVVEKAYVSAAGIVSLILTGFLRAGYNEFKVEHQMDLDIFQFEFHGTGFLGGY